LKSLIRQDRRDIRVIVIFSSRRGEHPERWSWEIRRKSKPLGIKLSEDGFQSDSAAQFAGKRALEDFMSELTRGGTADTLTSACAYGSDNL
jgi:hypothetical protein